MSKSSKEIIALIEKGLKLTFEKLLENKIKSNQELIISDGKGNPVKINAKDLVNKL
jgi:hypothetical protein